MTDYRERSRSPKRVSRKVSRSHDRENSGSRSRSPRRSGHQKRHYHVHKHEVLVPTRALPLNAQTLSRHNLSTHWPLFGLYLDVQKNLDIDEISENEIKGRWKSFVKKWNAGDLAEGWYDKKTFEKAKDGVFGLRDQNEYDGHDDRMRDTNESSHSREWTHNRNEGKDEDDDQDFGPSLPQDMADTSRNHSSNALLGPSAPSTHDLRVRDELTREDADAIRNAYVANVRTERKIDRRLQRERLDEITPKAEPGSRERQLEKKRDVAMSNRAFAASKDAGGDLDLRDADVMGEDGAGELKRMKELEQRKKTEREVRREELLRARNAEREEKMKGLREKEAKTMEMLQSIARARFGGGQ